MDRKVASKKYNILIVDDEKEIVEMLSRGLSRYGYVIQSALSGEEALEKLRRQQFDILILDIVLPGINGIQVLEKAREINPQAECIMITAHGTAGTIIESMRKGACDFIDKPLTIDKIVTAIEKGMEQHQLKETVALYEISKVIFSTIEIDTLLSKIIEISIKVLEADDISVMLFDEDKKLYIAMSTGVDEEVKRNTRLAMGERVAGWVAENSQPVVLIDGITNDERFRGVEHREEILSSIVAPLKKENTVLGVLSANRTRIASAFTEADVYKANIFFSLVSLAIDNALIYRKMKEKDSLPSDASSERLSALVSEIVHDFNNPLMVISGRVQLSLMETIENDEVKKNLSTIFDECKRAKQMLEDIRAKYKDTKSA